MRRFRPCKVCEPSSCDRKWLYVVEDTQAGLIKVGQTTNIHGRMAKYRAGGRVPIELRFKAAAGCEYRCLDLESKILRYLRKRFPNPRGDWFSAPTAYVIGVVERICAGAYTEHQP